MPVRALAEQNVERLIIESCDQDSADRQIIGNTLADLGLLERIEVLHSRPADDPMLWAADAVAWAYGRKGGFWTTELARLATVTRIDG